MNKSEREVLARHLKAQFAYIRESLLGELNELKAENGLLRKEIESLRVVRSSDEITVKLDGDTPLLSAKQISEVIAEIAATIERPAPTHGKDGRDGKDGEDASDEQVERAVAKYLAANPIRASKDGVDGKDGADGEDGRDGKDGRDGANGKSVDIEDVRAILIAESARAALSFERHANGILQAAIERIATPENVTREQVAALCFEQMKKALEEIPVPKDGADGAPVSIEQVEAAVERFIKANPLPTPKDGKDAAPITDEQISKAVQDYLFDHPIPAPKDGQSFAIEDARAILEGMSAAWALDFEKRAQSQLQSVCDRIPVPRDGIDGKDGADISNIETEISDDGRTFTMSYGAEGNRKSVSYRVPAIIDVGVWKADQQYEPGDSVTYDGSSWICKKSTKSKPGDYNKDWRLSVRKGRNGKS